LHGGAVAGNCVAATAAGARNDRRHLDIPSRGL